MYVDKKKQKNQVKELEHQTIFYQYVKLAIPPLPCSFPVDKQFSERRFLFLLLWVN